MHLPNACYLQLSYCCRKSCCFTVTAVTRASCTNFSNQSIKTSRVFRK
ncbi:hypothetical protein LJC08_02005 [Methanimicrococcus sp. OttesenSCG-928-J09]|nr:hypothetical protein [Methanimicrococcus sp. OttesenSCG-928-J09]